MQKDININTQPTRKHTYIKVYVLPEEKAQIKLYAQQAHMTDSMFLRLLGLGYTPKSLIDLEKVDELARISGNLGRLGGLLKLWLTNDQRTAKFGKDVIEAALARIDETQNEMVAVMQQIVLPRSKRAS